MAGLMADINVDGHFGYLKGLIRSIGLLDLLAREGVEFVRFRDRGLPPDLSDRELWRHCQASGLILFTADKNDDGPDSLQATIDDSWRTGDLPVLTIADKPRFERDGGYARRAAADVAEILFRAALGEAADRPRIFVPW